MSHRGSRIAAIVGLFCVAAFGIYFSLPGLRPLVDLGGFIESGRALRAGLDPYGAYPMPPRALVAGQPVPWPNANPPLSLPLDVVLSLLDPPAAQLVWWVISLVVYLAAVALLIREHPRSDRLLVSAWVLAISPFWLTLGEQVYPVLAVAAVASWTLLKRERRLMAALPLGLLIALKPNFALWPFSLLLVGEVAPAALSLAVALALTALPIAWYGLIVYQEWLHALVAYPYAPWAAGQSVFSIGLYLGHPEWGDAIGLALAVLLCFGWLVWLRRIRGDLLRVSEGALILTLLISPVSWDGYLLLLLPVFVWRPLHLPGKLAAGLMVIGVAVPIVHWPIAGLLLIDHLLDGRLRVRPTSPDAPASTAAATRGVARRFRPSPG